MTETESIPLEISRIYLPPQIENYNKPLHNNSNKVFRLKTHAATTMAVVLTAHYRTKAVVCRIPYRLLCNHSIVFSLQKNDETEFLNSERQQKLSHSNEAEKHLSTSKTFSTFFVIQKCFISIVEEN
jgi:hypothetical protein